MLIKTTIEDHRIAKLAAVAIALHMLEAVIPSPLPGVKPGIANIVTLYVLLKYGFASAAWVSMLRVFASSLLLGQFLSPTFILSLAGAMLSLGVLRLCMYLPKKHFGTVAVTNSKMEELQAFIALSTMVKEAEVKHDQGTHYLALNMG